MEPIYSIISKENNENNWIFKVQINQDHPIYQGHFPQEAIVPGVVLVQMLKELVESILDKKIKLKEAKSIKFIKMIYPSMVSQMEVTIVLTETDSLKVVAEFKIDEITYCKVTAFY